MLAKTADLDFVAKELQYHRICRLNYFNRAQAARKLATSMEDKAKSVRQAHKCAFQNLSSCIKLNILEKEEVHSLLELYNHYMSLFVEFTEETHHGNGFTIGHLEERIMKRFGDQVIITRRNRKRKGKIVFSSQMDTKVAIKQFYENSMGNTIQVRQVASMLRHEIRNAKKTELPSQLTVDDIIRGDVEVPELLNEFIKHLIHGPDTISVPSPRKQVFSNTYNIFTI